MAKINIGTVSDKNMMRRIERFKSYMHSAFNNKLTTNKSICGFFTLSPRGKSNISTVMFNNKIVALVGDKTFQTYAYDDKVFGGVNKMKFDVLIETRNTLLGHDPDEQKEPEKEVEQKETTAVKKPAKRTRKKKQGK